MYISIYTFQRVAPTTPPGTTLVSFSHKTLKFELNTLNLALGGTSVISQNKISYSFWGAVPLHQRSTTAISPPVRKSYRSAPGSLLTL